MTSILAFGAVFLTLVLFHELGHFLVAKSVGVAVYEFSIGFGPAVGRFRRGLTTYSLRAFPLGGFVRLAGMESTAEERRPSQERLAPDDPRRFNNRPLWQRTLTIVAGPAMNFLLAAFLFALLYVPPVVGEVEPASPAAIAGVVPGDRVVRIEGMRTPTAARVLRAVHAASPGDVLLVEVLRDGRVLRFSIQTAEHPRGPVAYIGVRWKGRPGALEALYGGLVEMLDSTGEIVRAVGRMLLGREAISVAGPAGIFTMVAEAADRGLLTLIGVAAVLNLNLGLINLLPLPVLDGGWLLFLGLEWLRRRPLEPQLQTLAQMLGLMILITLMLIATYFDLKRLGAG